MLFDGIQGALAGGALGFCLVGPNVAVVAAVLESVGVRAVVDRVVH